ncbi:carbohydrate ABC transporter permease [Paenibacillus chartarius]|uniref:Carbohydrate ABC transporter permease n=1 Tax=Paenibacillus chartarius TaxID=747481 RepID=A0ABV6DK52_9BACL
MDTGNRYGLRWLTIEVITVIIAILFLVPFYFLFVNSVKSFGELLSDSAGWPNEFHFENYSKAWKITNFPHVFWNSLQITVLSNIGIVLFASMAAYRMVRRNTRINRFLFSLFVAAMVIPFQSIMIPLVKVTYNFGLLNSIWGLTVCYFGFGIPLSLFLFHGFVKSIPLEVEESAVVDGSSPYGVFFRIVLPLLKPMFVTVIILNSLWIWNDFLLPSLILQRPSLRTIPMATFSFFGQYTKQWDLALPALVLGITPIIIFFLALQRYIVEGITAGSVKG